MRFRLIESEDIEQFSNEYDSEGNQLTKAQAEFFKNSKVRDNKGRLLVCYHGTNKEFDVFQGSKLKWFTNDIEYAGTFSHIEGEKHYNKTCYLNCVNPLTIEDIDEEFYIEYDEDDKDYSDSVYDIANKLDISLKDLDLLYMDVEQTGFVYDLTRSEEFFNVLKDRGYDGLFAIESYYKTYGVIAPNQIKSITNKNPTNSDNINENK